LAFFFDVSPGIVHAYVRKIVGIMDAHFEQKESIRMPSDQEMTHQQAQPCRAGTTDLGPVAAAVDGFVVRISGPAQPEGWGEISTSHQVHENVYVFNLLLMVLMTGTILFLSQAFPAGKYTDQRIWNYY
jgi:acetylornithine deacetylase/succinyl-diaminopimelate desuccinylase-like protein